MGGTPTILFGAGGIGTTATSFTYTWETPEAANSLLQTLSSLHIQELDSAASYPPGNPWNTETLLGQAGVSDMDFAIDTKVAIHEGFALNDATIPASIDKSLVLMGVKKVRTLYAHVPDPSTPIEETAKAFHRQYLAGKFERLGICNYSTEETAALFAVCDAKGYVKPSVYQGHYNAVVRGHEEALLPLLRKHGANYYAYSPLGGGFLTGKVTFASSTPDSSNSLTRTRWAGESTMSYYPTRYDKPIMHDALRALHAMCETHNMPLSEVCLRWLMHHSALGNGDGLILGAKRVEQLVGNVGDCRRGPLEGVLVQAVEEMWRRVGGTERGKGSAL